MKCRICGCTYEHGCPAGCDWAEVNLCTVCANFRDELAAYWDMCLSVSAASLRRLLREVQDGLAFSVRFGDNAHMGNQTGKSGNTTKKRATTKATAKQSSTGAKAAKKPVGGGDHGTHYRSTATSLCDFCR